MKKFVVLLTKEKRLRMNRKMMTLTFFKTILSLGQFFFHTYSLTCLNKDSSLLLKLKYKDSGLNFFLKCYAYAHNPFNKVIKFLKKKKYTLHTIACLTLSTRVFCHRRVENLLKGPVSQ